MYPANLCVNFIKIKKKFVRALHPRWLFVDITAVVQTFWLIMFANKSHGS